MTSFIPMLLVVSLDSRLKASANARGASWGRLCPMPPVLVVLALPEKFFPENLFAQVLWPLVLREQRRQELDCHAR